MSDAAIFKRIFKCSFLPGRTSLLIAVVVTMDFMSQVQSHLMSQQYDSLMKKGKFKECW